MPATTNTLWTEEPEAPARGGARSLVTPTALALALGVALGAVGWKLQEPGGQVVVETLIVAGIGLGTAGVAWIVACFTPSRRGLWVFAILSALTSLAAGFWTFEFAMSASLVWTSATTRAAHDALARAERGPRGRLAGLSAHPCSTIQSGNIGPLRAPYRICADPPTHGKYVVSFFVVTRRSPGVLAFPNRGLVFTNVSEPAPDACARHLVGTWWTFVGSPTGDCPLGYQFHPGG